jgi:hypothetical protein
MTETFSLETMKKYKPFVSMTLGARRQGKSVLNSHLATQLSDEFQLVISFTGSPMCNPELHGFMVENGYEWFQYSTWNNKLMKNLESQQLKLIHNGRKRHVLIICDDLVLNSEDKNSLEHLCCRGRHFFVSVLMLSVAYSNFPKTCRRSCDFMFLFSLGCQSDRELLLSEFCQSRGTAEFYLTQICKEPYTCAVIGTNQKEQIICRYRAPYATDKPNNLDQQNIDHGASKNDNQHSANIPFSETHNQGHGEQQTVPQGIEQELVS